MFPESFVEEQVATYTKPGDLVFDPFCGRGTTPFQALLMDRNAAGCDVNPVAFCITRAKTNAPEEGEVVARISELQDSFDPCNYEDAAERLPDFFRHAFHPRTLREILHLQKNLQWEWSDTDTMVAALVLGALHGESHRSPFYFSNQMPRTISTKPDYSIRFWQSRGIEAPDRDAFEILRQRTGYRYATGRPERSASIERLDMREYPNRTGAVLRAATLAVTSPPYLNVTNFEEDQWLRLWFLGGEPFPTRKQVSKDDRYYGASTYWPLVEDMWAVLGKVMAPGGHVVVRIGGKGLTPEQLGEGVKETSEAADREVEPVGDYKVSSIRKRQTDSFRPGSKGCLVEVDCTFRLH